MTKDEDREIVDQALQALAAPVQELYIVPGLSTLTHSDNCRYWDDSEFCTCGAAEYHELNYWKTKALAAQPTQDLSRLKPFVHGLGQAILQELMTTPPAALLAQEIDAVETLTEEGWIWDGDQWQRPPLWGYT